MQVRALPPLLGFEEREVMMENLISMILKISITFFALGGVSILVVAILFAWNS